MKRKLLLSFLMCLLMVVSFCFLTACDLMDCGGNDPDDGDYTPPKPEVVLPKPTEGLEYVLNEDGTAYILTGIGTADESEILIAEKYNNLPVTEISADAFSGLTTIEKVEMPDTITAIGKDVFQSCASLREVKLSKNIKSIPDRAFLSCVMLKEITLPEGVTNVGANAFQYCYAMARISVPSTLSFIGSKAFDSCYSLVEICNKSEVINLDNGGFNGLGQYKIRVYQSGVSNVTEHNGFMIYNNEDQKILVSYVGKATDVIVPDNIDVINAYAFYNNRNIESVVVSEGVKEIGSRAFGWCSFLKRVTFPQTLNMIKANAFSECLALIEVTFTDASGWKATGKSLSYSQLSNTSTAARLLRSDYCNKIWEKN